MTSTDAIWLLDRLATPTNASLNSSRSLIHSKYNRSKITPAHTVIGCSVKPNNIFGYSGDRSRCAVFILTHYSCYLFFSPVLYHQILTAESGIISEANFPTSLSLVILRLRLHAPRC